MSNRHYLINSEDLQNLNAKLLSIAFSKDEGDWKSIMQMCIRDRSQPVLRH